MDEVRDIQKRYCSQALIAAIGLFFLLLFMGEKPLGKGLLLGALFSVINFIIMGQLIGLKLDNSRSKATSFALFSIFFRFTVMAVPLVISLEIDSIDFFFVAIGLFMVQITMLFDHLILNRDSFTSNIQKGR